MDCKIFTEWVFPQKKDGSKEPIDKSLLPDNYKIKMAKLLFLSKSCLPLQPAGLLSV